MGRPTSACSARAAPRAGAPGAILLLVVGLGLAGCNAGGNGNGPAADLAPPPPAAPASVAALLPLTGAAASLGRSMLDSIQLGLARSPLHLDVIDTGGDPAGAAKGATAAVAHHDALILGPLTSAETRAAAPVATAAGVPVLAWTSDPAAARAGVWVLGLTAEQQVSRLVDAARKAGRRTFAGFVPANALGTVMADALTRTVDASGGAPPTVVRHDASFASLNEGLKSLSAFDSRAGQRDATVRADEASSDPATKAEAATLAAAPVPPPPFDALLLADTGTQLGEIIDLLGPYDLKGGAVQLMGPALWGAFARKLGPIAGAWFAAPDPAARAGFARDYAARFHATPRPIDDFAFDSAALAAALASSPDGITTAELTRPDGFAGTDGVFMLRPDGHVRRGLAVFQVDAGGGAHIVSAAPTRLTGPGGA